MKKDTTYIDLKKKALVAGGRYYPLLYGFVSPFNADPVLAIVKSAKELENTCGRVEHFHNEGHVSGLLFRTAGKSHIEEQRDGGEEEKYVRCTYLYGLKEENLIEKAHAEMYLGRKLTLETFKKKLLAGELKNIKAAREAVKGNDLIIASKGGKLKWQK